ncbi:MAG: hypothetical protein LBK60_08120 [Verrucomicrobiales bacterium]|jgi:hypothetical protein|nr:hypothetical protein [Verrucomicrobiales bacterium]
MVTCLVFVPVMCVLLVALVVVWRCKKFKYRPLLFYPLIVTSALTVLWVVLALCLVGLDMVSWDEMFDLVVAGIMICWEVPVVLVFSISAAYLAQAIREHRGRAPGKLTHPALTVVASVLAAVCALGISWAIYYTITEPVYTYCKIPDFRGQSREDVAAWALREARNLHTQTVKIYAYDEHADRRHEHLHNSAAISANHAPSWGITTTNNRVWVSVKFNAAGEVISQQKYFYFRE